MPLNRKHPLPELLGCLGELFPAAGRRTGGDFVLIEYVLLAGVNDSDADAARLVALTEPLFCVVNLIVFNHHEGSAFRRSPEDRVRSFAAILTAAGRYTTVRKSKGDDEMAACGQLGDRSQAPREAPLLLPPEVLRAALAGAGAGVV
jgi:23S rRNA (adenine2503-C2)-methyltransferase